MEGKIDINGSLHIKRGSILKRVRCKYNRAYSCEDVCGVFGEPCKYNNKVYLEICNIEHEFDIFTDERK